MATLLETVQSYQKLLAIQYRTKPKARAQIAIYVKQALGDMLATQLMQCFDVDNAVGNQLDILGKYIGVPRMIGDPIALPFYNFSDSVGPILRQNGFQSSTDPQQNAQAIWYQSTMLGTSKTALTDVAYRLVLKLQIILNTNDGTLMSIQQYLFLFLNGLVALVDNANMSLTYTISDRSPVSPAVLQQFLPKPMGVGLIINDVKGVAAPSSRTNSVSGAGFQVVVSDIFTVTPSGGVGPYTYRWENVSGYNKQIDVGGPEGIFPFQSGGPTSPTAVFWLQGFATLVTTGTWRCAVIDSRGIIGYTQPVTVNLTINP